MGTIQCCLATSHAERVRIISDGNVGIGTNAPSALLHLHNSGGDVNLRLDASGTTPAFLRFAQSDTTKWDIGSNIGGLTSHQFSFYAQGTGNVVTILTDGKVGIGTDAPTSYSASTKVLHVLGYER